MAWSWLQPPSKESIFRFFILSYESWGIDLSRMRDLGGHKTRFRHYHVCTLLELDGFTKYIKSFLFLFCGSFPSAASHNVSPITMNWLCSNNYWKQFFERGKVGLPSDYRQKIGLGLTFKEKTTLNWTPFHDISSLSDWCFFAQFWRKESAISVVNIFCRHSTDWGRGVAC